jgi:hypothetical protein
MADVFVSYASADRDVAFRIVGYLEEQGIRCWVAPRDVGPGVEYGEAIIDAIGEARALVLVLSDQSNESQFVRKEVERAVSKTKPVLPVRIREVTPSGALEFYISSAQWVDAWKSPMEQHLLPLVAAIKAMGAPGAAPVRSVAPPLATPRAGARHGVSIGLALVAVAALGAAAALWFARAPAPAQAPEAEQRSVPAAAEPSSAELAEAAAEAAISAQEAPLPADAIENVEAATEAAAAAAAARSAPPAPAPAPAVTQVAPVPAGPSRSDVAFFTGTWCQPYNGLTIVYEVIRTGADTVLTRVDHPQAAPWDVPSRIVPVAGGFEMQPVDEPVAADNTARFEIVDDSMMKLVFANGAVEDGSILRMRCDGRKD